MIIFDLDDTLIDTSGAVTPFKMGLCLEKMGEVGVLIPPFESAYQELLSMNRTSAKSQEAIAHFGKKYGATQEQIQAAFTCLTSPLPPDFRVPMTPHAEEILTFYGKRYPLAIVTGGHPPFQLDKLKKAGIEVSFFSMIGIPEDSVKKPYYCELQKKFQLPPEKIWVCGDRVEMDLKPAFELGFQTVHMRWGRGSLMPSPAWVTHKIQNLYELKEKIP